MSLSAALAISALFFATGHCQAPLLSFNWTSIEPTPDLRYHPCFGNDNLRCARLEVPLDWKNVNDTRTVALAIISLKAVVSEDDPSFGGTIVANPGGPGGSGVDLVLKAGQLIQSVMDRDKHYEILSFDPRGVHNSTPTSMCFDSPALREQYALQALAVGGWGTVDMESGLNAISRQKSMQDAYGIVCRNHEEKTHILRYVSTASVATDMVRIIDQVDELRHKLSNVTVRGNATREPARIQYYGVSYGTFLGNTFASMYPSRVGRMLLDSVIDAGEYLTSWRTNLNDVESIVDSFYDTCFKADNCQLKEANYTSAKQMKSRVDAMIAAVDKSPVPVVLDDGRATVVDGNAIRNAFVSMAYTPSDPAYGFPLLGQILSEGLASNFTGLASSRLPVETDEPGNIDYGTPVICADGDDVTHYDVSTWSNYFQELIARSATGAPTWASVRFNCAGWPVRPNWRFTGPFQSPPPSAAPHLKDASPAAPMLLLANRLDPATPKDGAFLTSGGHPKSSVVIQDTVGHGVLINALSSCTLKLVQDYMEFGTVPKNGTLCATGCDPWNPSTCFNSA
ncbi:hypothetical protein GQ53DRAFT_875839 [Thozetella sp. PMI_491]|nr:hypothetical protein GQ53DRAFT_875839 [Thozetella sp. PMI_491]